MPAAPVGASAQGFPNGGAQGWLQALMQHLGGGGGRQSYAPGWMRTANRHPQATAAYTGPVGIEGALPGGNSRFVVPRASASTTGAYSAASQPAGYSALLSYLQGGKG